MRVAWLAVASALLSGCNAEQLRFTSLRLSRSIPDLQERQVIDNLARLAEGPGNLPYYTVFSTGTVNINDTGSGGLGALTLQHKVFPLGTLNGTASRSVTGNWTLNALSNPDRLRAMRAAYMIALGVGPVDPADQEQLRTIIKGRPEPSVRPGWLCAGGKRDVPRGAWISGRCGDTAVWVMPRNSKEFADFSLLILNIATWTAPSPPNTLSLSVDKAVPLLIGTAPRSAPQAGAAPEAAPVVPPIPENYLQPGVPASAAPAPSLPRRLYEDSPTMNRGLFFVPR